MLRLDIRTKIIILLTISTSTFIVNTLWIEVLCVIILSGMQLAFGKKVFSKWLVFAYVILFFRSVYHSSFNANSGGSCAFCYCRTV